MSSTSSKSPDIVAQSKDEQDVISLQLDNLQNSLQSTAVVSLSETLPPLDSFISIIEKLPGLVLDNGQYLVNGPLLMTDLSELVSYTRKITEVILTDTDSTEPEVSSETLARLALVQDPKNPFLSSLRHLRLINADESLSYLFFCVTPSLKTLEIIGAPLNRQITVSSFIRELVLGAPQLENIILRGCILESVLDCIPKFNNLRQLHLVDLAAPLKFSFLKALSMLADLEELVVEATTTEYTGYLSSSTSSTDDDIIPVRGGVTPCTATEPNSIPFRRLQKLAIAGNVVLIGDIVRYLHPRSVKDVSLTLVRHSPPAPIGSHTIELSDPMFTISCKSEAWECEEDHSTRRPNKKIRMITIWIPVTKDGNGLELSYEEQRYRYYLSQMLEKLAPFKNANNVPTPASDSQTLAFGETIEQILDLGLPESIFLDHSNRSSNPTIGNFPGHNQSPVFPLTALKKLLSNSNLKELKIRHWEIPEILPMIPCDTDSPTAVPPLSLELTSLELPVDKTSSVPISAMHHIVHRFPRLARLECYVTVPSPAASTLDLGPHIPHMLEFLSIGGPISSPEEKVSIATYLSLLFPRLKAIETPNGHDEDWGFVYSLIKMCQTVSLGIGQLGQPNVS
ncbi:hypothetical protein BDN70DRAFT_989708 [Pholiota conissans]|uniref:Uncharacterized protein n=1 Tax=Pholiota conissans TaxID=109636 RepID=A0A9P5ZAS4_9AGAR|nr:hypothetical protein BDN70DRAFT_989708 [Pholiota conissans]